MRTPRFDQAKVLTLGDVMLDRYWHGDTARISAEAPIPVVNVSDIEDRPGGAANVALNIASLGAVSSLVAATGKDEAADLLRQKLETSGIRCAFLELPEHPTTTKIRIVSRNQQMIRADFEQPGRVDGAALLKLVKGVTDYDNLILSDYDKGVLSAPESVIRHATKLGKPILVDPKFRPFSAYRGVTLIKPNKLELEHAVGRWSTEAEMVSKCQALMADLGIEAMLVTRSAEGMTLIARDSGEVHFPAHTREVYDTTGAGDTVVAVLAAALAAGETLHDAAALSNVAAGLVVSQFGVTSVSGPELRGETAHVSAPEQGRMTAEQLSVAVQAARERGERVVFTNGCFDIIHAGHVDYLDEAKQEGDRLIVAVNDDNSVRRLKGEGRPINPLDRRMTILAGLASVDWVVSFAGDTPEELLRTLKPEVLVKGGDYTIDQVVGADIVRDLGGQVKVLKLVDDCSTSALVEKIRDL